MHTTTFSGDISGDTSSTTKKTIVFGCCGCKLHCSSPAVHLHPREQRMNPFTEGVVLSRNPDNVVAEGAENHPEIHFGLLQGHKAREKRWEHVVAAKQTKGDHVQQPHNNARRQGLKAKHGGVDTHGCDHGCDVRRFPTEGDRAAMRWVGLGWVGLGCQPAAHENRCPVQETATAVPTPTI